MKKFLVPLVIVVFVAAVVVVALVCTEEVHTSTPPEVVTSSCVDCHSDIELLETVAEVPVEVEEPEEPSGEG
ncbi:MAG: hypothetical protein ACOC58_05495 [Chloroflexota bacterium]